MNCECIPSIIGIIVVSYFTLSFSVKVAHVSVVRFLGQIKLGQDKMRNDIFDPILTEIFNDLYEYLTCDRASFSQRYLMFSGVLAECPYVHSFMRSQVNSFQDLSDIVIINTRDE